MNILADSFSHVLGTPLKKTKIMEIFINVGGSALPNSINEKNTFYFNTRPLFETI